MTMRLQPGSGWQTKGFVRECRVQSPAVRMRAENASHRLVDDAEHTGPNLESIHGASRGVKFCLGSRSVLVNYRVSPGRTVQLPSATERIRSGGGNVTFLSLAVVENGEGGPMHRSTVRLAFATRVLAIGLMGPEIVVRALKPTSPASRRAEVERAYRFVLRNGVLIESGAEV